MLHTSQLLHTPSTPHIESPTETLRVTIQASLAFCLENMNRIDMSLVTLVDGIPHFSWGGTIHAQTRQLIEGIEIANFETIVGICTRFDTQEDNHKYWHDLRERNFVDILKAIDKRLPELGNEVVASKLYDYRGNSGKSSISIPSVFRKKI